jgi:hypothetical protein
MSDEVSNVIPFPKASELPTNLEEVGLALHAVQELYLEQISAEVSGDVFTRLINMGYDISDESYLRDTILVVESIKSLLMRVNGKTYPLQSISDSMIIEDEDGFVLDDEDLIDI